ncbi:DUF1330 domain-containing protein [Candidatus Omnitrophota bacterium]
MKRIILALLAVVVIFQARLIPAQEEKKVPVYMIIEIEILDQATYNEYSEKARPIVEKYNGRYLARGGKVTALSGEWKPNRIVLVEFPSAADLKRCFDSQEYKEIASLRERSAIGKSIMVEGNQE